ncbi:pimeloyl-ACP methyl ester carboxylesterase [Arthrobacter pascens]|uniref:alpha/beta fold hydrolase n=1 Tax=Arthrobacter pascens TaxID=1677 RepID=UPI00278F466A|nr:alpha/beta hydrolase [Arthrobacter pascens]MDQ0678598.1 pimeloyl-ACP methyl ester carboxylesterase [Arthrobacter pascens]
MSEQLRTQSRNSPTLRISAVGAEFAYREFGPQTGVPLVVLTHLGANLDSWDPRIVDGLAEDRHVIAVGYRGVGDSTGHIRDSIEDMAEDMVAVIRALGYDRVDVFGLSMGGMVAQAFVERAPGLIDRLVLSGSGPAGGPGLTDMTRITIASVLRAVLTFQDPKALLFFTRTPAGKKAAREYLARLKERTAVRDKAVTPGVYRAQLAALHRWGMQQPSDLSQFTGPVLIVHGDSDRMVPSANATELTRQLASASVLVFPDSGHGVAFQNYSAFVDVARDFLRR